MKIYVMIAKDKYELPLAVADSVIELARIVGVTPNAISCEIWKHEHGHIKKSKYIRVESED